MAGSADCRPVRQLTGRSGDDPENDQRTALSRGESATTVPLGEVTMTDPFGVMRGVTASVLPEFVWKAQSDFPVDESRAKRTPPSVATKSVPDASIAGAV